MHDVHFSYVILKWLYYVIVLYSDWSLFLNPPLPKNYRTCISDTYQLPRCWSSVSCSISHILLCRMVLNFLVPLLTVLWVRYVLSKIGYLESLCPHSSAVWVVSSLVAECVVGFLKNVQCKCFFVLCTFFIFSALKSASCLLKIVSLLYFGIWFCSQTCPPHLAWMEVLTVKLQHLQD